MHILVSNDDGVYAPGIRILHEHLAAKHQVTVVAPDRDFSAASKSLTLNCPIRTKTIEEGFISVEGTPTDCVHLALSEIVANPKPDLVVAGINSGMNLGDDVLYSGTVAAATEGYFFGVPSIALSQAGPPNNENFIRAAKYFCNFLDEHLDEILNKDMILNINFPEGEIRGTEVCRLGARHRISKMIKDKDPRGNDVYWVGPPSPEQDAGPGTDFYATGKGMVSITPLQMDLTRYNELESVSSWVSKDKK